MSVGIIQGLTFILCAFVTLGHADPMFSKARGDLPVERGLDFKVGQALFERLWVKAPSSTQAADGLGPLYNTRACVSCHHNNGKGHPPLFGRKHQLVIQVGKHGLPEPIYGYQIQPLGVAGINAEASVEVAYSEEKLLTEDGQVNTLHVPAYSLTHLSDGDLMWPGTFSPRVPNNLLGIGLIERITDSDILSYVDENDDDRDGISGRANWVRSVKTDQKVLGRYGHKANVGFLDEQIQLAFVRDMGLSTPLFPHHAGDCTTLQTVCRSMPHGNSPQYSDLEVDQTMIDLVNLYVGYLKEPVITQESSKDHSIGRQLFNELACHSCHREAYTVNGQQIRPYSDFLLHDMGRPLADHRTDGVATGREWRTAPLWGIGNTKRQTGFESYLHDGRARTLTEAIVWHGGEAKKSRDGFVTLPEEKRVLLLDFLRTL